MTESDGYDDRGDNNHDLISQNNKKKEHIATKMMIVDYDNRENN